MRPVLNRVLLFLSGLVLLAGGLAVAFRSRGWFRGLLHTPYKPLITSSQAHRLTEHHWWWWVAFAVPVTLGLVCLWWLLAQFHRRPVRALHVYEVSDDPAAGPSGLGTGFGMVGDDADTLTVTGAALMDAIAEDMVHVSGVEHGSVRLVRRRRGPVLFASVRAEAGAEPRTVLEALHDEVIAHAVHAVGLERLPAVVELRTSRGLPERKLQ